MYLLYNETNGVGFSQHLQLQWLELNEDANKVLPSCVQENGNILYLLGETKSEFGASLYMKKCMEK